jgi:hypothetical protein
MNEREREKENVSLVGAIHKNVIKTEIFIDFPVPTSFIVLSFPAH